MPPGRKKFWRVCGKAGIKEDISVARLLPESDERKCADRRGNEEARKYPGKRSDELASRMMLVSACLAGIKCCYNGENAPSREVESLVRKKSAIPVCPEQIGGLSTPREPAEIVGGDGRDVLEGRARVLTRRGEDVTQQYIRGTEEVLKIAKMVGAKKVILKRNSPACGFGEIYHEGRLVKGNGVCTALLIKHGIEVVKGDSD